MYLIGFTMKFPQSYYLSDVPPVKMIYSNNDAYQILMLIQKKSTPNQTSTLDNTLRTDDHDEVVRHGRKI